MNRNTRPRRAGTGGASDLRMVVGAVLLALSLALAWLLASPARYVSQAALVAEPGSACLAASGSQECRNELDLALGRAMELLRGDAVLRSVLAARRPESPGQTPASRTPADALKRLLAPYFPAAGNGAPASEERALANLRDSIVVTRSGSAPSLTLRVETAVAAEAQDRARAVLDAFEAQGNRSADGTAPAAAPDRDRQAIEDSIGALEHALDAVLSKAAAAAQASVPDQLPALEADLVRAQAERAALQLRVTQLARQSGDPLGAQGPQSPAMTALRARLADLARREADALELYGPAHPAVAALRGERSRLDRLAADEAARLLQAARDEAATADTRSAAIAAGIERLKAQRQPAPDISPQGAAVRAALQALKASLAAWPAAQPVAQPPRLKITMQPTAPVATRTIAPAWLLSAAAAGGAALGLAFARLRRAFA